MINIGDTATVFKNPEDIMSLVKLEVVDVYEVSLQETYAKIKEDFFALSIEFGEKINGKYGEGRFPFILLND